MAIRVDHKAAVETIPHNKECNEYNRQYPGCGVRTCPRCIADCLFYDYRELFEREDKPSVNTKKPAMDQGRIDKFVRAAMVAVMSADDANFAMFMNKSSALEKAITHTTNVGIHAAEMIGFEWLGEEE